MELIIKDGDTLLFTVKDSDHFTFDTGETEDDKLLIYATQILILTPKALKWYKFFRFCLGLITHLKEAFLKVEKEESH